MPVAQNVIRLLGRYSEGLRLTAEHGPKSGIVLEYAYQNLPQGSGTLGRWIDQRFLRMSAWQSIRERKHTTKELVAELVARRRAAKRSTMILDVAAGTGRYLRELAREQATDDLLIVCHDRNPREVTLGRQLVKQEALPRFTFSVGDATDDSSYLTSRDPDIVLAVGLFATLHRDDAVRTVMRLAFGHLGAGGCFLCTTLAKHNAWDPDSFGARPAYRAAETIAAWLRAAGFVNIDQRYSQPQGFALMGWKPES